MAVAGVCFGEMLLLVLLEKSKGFNFIQILAVVGEISIMHFAGVHLDYFYLT